MRGTLRRKACLVAGLEVSEEWFLFWIYLAIPSRPLCNGICSCERIAVWRYSCRRDPGTDRGWSKEWMRSSEARVHCKGTMGCLQITREHQQQAWDFGKALGRSPSSETAVRLPVSLQLSVLRALWATSEAAHLRGTTLSVFHLSKLSVCLLLIFRHKNSDSQAWV